MKILIIFLALLLNFPAYAQTPKSTDSPDQSPQTTTRKSGAVVTTKLRSFQEIKSDVYDVCYKDLSEETVSKGTNSAQSERGVKLLITSSRETGEVKRVNLLQSEVSDEHLKRCIVKQTAKLVIPESAREPLSSQFMRELHVTKDRVMLGSDMVMGMGTGTVGTGVVRSSNKRESERKKKALSTVGEVFASKTPLSTGIVVGGGRGGMGRSLTKQKGARQKRARTVAASELSFA